MTIPSTSSRSDAIRAGLIAHVASSRPRTRAGWAAGLVAVGAIAGAGVSAAAFAATDNWPSPGPETHPVGNGIVIEQPAGQPTPAMTERIVAPEGVIPGLPVITVVGDPTSLTVTSSVEVPFADQPAEATHVRVTVTCLTVGTIAWGTDPSGNNPASSCTASDGRSASGTAWLDLPLDESTTTLFVKPEGQATASVTLQYVNYIPTLFGVNEHGETYGSGVSDQGLPDLIFVETTTTDGNVVPGYVRATDLLSAGHAGQPSDLGGWDIPVFQVDGTTQIGTFHVGD